MCTILLRLDPHADEPVVLAANRDEFRTRAADDPAEIAPGVFGGRDRQAGGTWLAIGGTGLAAVTNVTGARPRSDAPSRGRLPLEALGGALAEDLSIWNPFNLLVIDGLGPRVLTHDGGSGRVEVRVLGAGDHVIVNEPFAGSPGPRARRAAARLAAAAALGFEVLGDHGPPPDQGLCRHGDEYGTVSATIVALDRDLRVRRYLHCAGSPCAAPVRDLGEAARSVVTSGGA